MIRPCLRSHFRLRQTIGPSGVCSSRRLSSLTFGFPPVRTRLPPGLLFVGPRSPARLATRRGLGLRPLGRSRHVFQIVKERRDPLGDRCLADGKNNNCRHLRLQQFRSPDPTGDQKPVSTRLVARQSHVTSNLVPSPSETPREKSTVCAARKEPSSAHGFSDDDYGHRRIPATGPIFMVRASCIG